MGLCPVSCRRRHHAIHGRGRTAWGDVLCDPAWHQIWPIYADVGSDQYHIVLPAPANAGMDVS